MLIMDEATAIVYFEKDGPEVLVNVDAYFPSIDYTINLQKPGQCDDTKNCLCLFRSSKFDTEGTELTVIPESSLLQSRLQSRGGNLQHGRAVGSEFLHLLKWIHD